MDTSKRSPVDMQQAEHELLSDLRRLRRALRVRRSEGMSSAEQAAGGRKVADVIVDVMGSWTFIVFQSVILFVWITANLLGATRGWDPYPFILLNLALSFQAAYSAPMIMMSQKRQQDIDRQAAASDYQINVKAELEIEALHEKIDELRAREVLELTEAVRCLADLLQRSSHAHSPGTARRPGAQQRDEPDSCDRDHGPSSTT